MTRKLSHKPILGYSDRATVKLDFDNELFRRVKALANRTMKHFRFRGYLILRSSRDHYHVVFNSTVTWEKNCKIMAWVSIISINSGLKKWTLMQLIKGASTLRVSSKQGKPSPRIVYRQGKQNHEISTFLRWRRYIKKADKQQF